MMIKCSNSGGPLFLCMNRTMITYSLIDHHLEYVQK